jgi:hypothetical protein
MAMAGAAATRLCGRSEAAGPTKAEHEADSARARVTTCAAGACCG